MNYHRKKQKNDKTFDSKELKKSEKKKERNKSKCDK